MSNIDLESLKYKNVDYDAEEYKSFKEDVSRFINATFKNEKPRNIGETVLSRNIKPTKKSIEKMFLNAYDRVEDLQSVSSYLNISSGNYWRLTEHFGSMPTYDLMLVPYIIPEQKKIDKERMIKSYLQCAEWLEKFSWRYEFSLILHDLVNNGEWFGYLVEDKDASCFWKLPSQYCRIKSYQDGVARIEFNVNFFSGGNAKLLPNYPAEFQALVNDYQNGKPKDDPTDTQLNWRLMSENGVAFTLNKNNIHGIPMFTGTFEDIMELEEYKGLTKDKVKLQNYAILHQKAPWKKDPKSFKDMLIPLAELREFHKGTKKNVSDRIGVVSNPLEMELLRFDEKGTDIDNVAKAERSIYNSSGVSSFLFNSDKGGNETVKKSLQADENIVYDIFRWFELWLKREIARIGTNQYQWKAKILDVTKYSHSEKLKESREDIALGSFKTEYLALKHYSPMEIYSMNIWENEVLNISETMIPAQSSHTQSSDSSNATATGKSQGRPQTDNPEEQTIKTREEK